MVGIVVAILVLVVGVLAMIYMIRKRKKIRYVQNALSFSHLLVKKNIYFKYIF